MALNRGGRTAILGFEYQILYGLYLLMKSDENVSEYVENYDDLTIENNGIIELIQMKRTGTPKIINDTSLEFWNSLRNWSYNIKDDNVILEKTNFILVTMNQVEESSILHCLKPEIGKYQEAYRKIHEIGPNANNETIRETYYPLFKSLHHDIQFELIKRISVLDQAPEMKDIKQKILTIIEGYTDKEFVNEYFSDVYGWWRATLLEKLDLNNNTPISWSELSRIRRDLRNKYRKQILLQTISPEDIKKSISPSNDSTFIKQLSIINITDNKSIFDAKLDFELAIRQNYSWIEENESYDHDIQKFKDNVKNNYLNKYDFEKNTITPNSNKENKIKWGQDMYRWSMFETNWKISESSQDSYKRGVLHGLADIPDIGWHPYYEEELED